MKKRDPAETAAVYLRVSTNDQNPENQRADLMRLAKARGFKHLEIYEETASTAKRRPKFDAMRFAAHGGGFRAILVWAIDRFGRSMLGNIKDVLELNRIGVRVVSFKESWLDTEGPTRDLLLAIFSWIAEQERRRISERTKAGLIQARKRGSRIGRPHRMGVALLARARGMRKAKLSLRAIAVALKVPRATLARALA
jgi:putative DNA-invertase from lambdoid prophage Rac